MPVSPSTMNPAVRLVNGPPGKVLHEENSRTALTIIATSGEARKLPQFLAAITATLGALCAGTFFSWSSSVSPDLINHGINGETISWIGSSLTLGALVGCLMAGAAADWLGRQRTLLLLSLPMLVSWVLLSVSADVYFLFMGRTLGGMAIGAVSVVVGMYVSEVAEPSVRGTLGSFFQLQITVGILLGYIAGQVHNLAYLGYINMPLPVLFAVLFWRMPESPVYLLSKNQSERARDALQWLRGPEYDIAEEMAAIRHSIMETKQAKTSVKDMFGSRAAVRGMIVAVGLMATQQLTAVNAIIFYTSSIFQSSGSSLSGDSCSIIVGVVQVLSTYVSTVLVDRAGRRVLLLLSSSVMTVCLAVLGTYFHLQSAGHDMAGITWLPLATVAVFIIAFSLGLGPLAWCVVSEIFSANIKGTASSIACGANWLMAFIVTKVFQNMVDCLGQGGSFLVFCMLTFLGTIFIAALVPETKGKTLEEIQAELAGVKSVPVAGPIEEEDEDDEVEVPVRTFTV